MSRKPRYNKQGWMLCACVLCGTHNYVEPHGTTAKCNPLSLAACVLGSHAETACGPAPAGTRATKRSRCEAA